MVIPLQWFHGLAHCGIVIPYGDRGCLWVNPLCSRVPWPSCLWLSCCCWATPMWQVRMTHDNVIKWKHFPCYWPFVRGIHRSPVNSPPKSQWCGALMFSLICAWINGWVNNHRAGDLRRHPAYYDVIVMTKQNWTHHSSNHKNKQDQLTHCGLGKWYGDLDLGQHWLR